MLSPIIYANKEAYLPVSKLEDMLTGFHTSRVQPNWNKVRIVKKSLTMEISQSKLDWKKKDCEEES